VRRESVPLRIVPELPGWVTANQAADRLGISRQSVARMMAEGVFRTQHGVGERPLYIVRVEEVERYLEHYERTRSWSLAAERLATDPDKKVGLSGSS
jgi:predicted site-specific integrase-resolvase